VFPEGVMKATAHWLELQGHTPPSKSTIFDKEFTDQVVATGKIEEGRIVRNFFSKTGQPLLQNWLVELAMRIARYSPVKLGFLIGLSAVFRPRTRKWVKARDAITEYVDAQETRQRHALGLREKS
jgi:heterodisulfide reductase subunit C